jgi:hypothetical protein
MPHQGKAIGTAGMAAPMAIATAQQKAMDEMTAQAAMAYC